MPGIYHEPIIKQLVKEHGFQVGKFANTVKAAMRSTFQEGPHWTREDLEMELEDVFDRFGKIPDCYYVNVEERAVIAVEVEHTSVLSADGLAQYGHLWWAFDGHGSWFFELLTCDRFNQFRHVNLYNGERKGYYSQEEAVNTILYCEKTPKTSDLIARLLCVPQSEPTVLELVP